MPLGLLRFTPTTIIHAFIVELHTKIVSRVSSKKYQFPEIQSNAISVIAENITNNFLTHVLTNNILLMKHQFITTHIIHQTDLYITRQLGYKHTFCQNAVSPKKFASTYIFVKT
jgi:hypothetical protein